jgi:S1-C subfamily serine protease
VKDENMTNHNIKIPLVKIADSLTRYRNTFQSQLKQEILKANEIVKIASKPKPELSEFLNGVNTIVIDYKMIWKDFSELCFYRGTQEFFKQHGFNIKENTNDGYSEYRPSKDICTEAWVSLECLSFNEQLSNMKMIIRTDCGNYEYVLDLSGSIDISQLREMNANYNNRVADFIASKFKINYTFDRSKSLNDSKFQTGWNEKLVRAKINHFGYDDLEGIYELNYTVQGQRLKVAVQKIKDTYTFIYLSGHTNENNWLTGEVIGYVTEGTDLGNYVVSWSDFRKKWTHNMTLSYVNNLYKIAGSDPKNVYFFKKLFPTAQDKALKNNPEMIASGTGWAISSNGYVITNYHVVEGSNQFALRGVKGDFSLKYNLRVILLDKENDIAILKVDDSNFSGFGTIPYTLSGSEGEVGASVYVLGYPLLASMGTEVKLTTGVISSSSGFQGDKRLYQISAPVQPGNSGGPMISYKGNLIGIVNAKHFEAENASYAIKSPILLGLIKENGLNISLPTSNLLSGKSLSEQVKLVRNFTYIIEVY